jgi:lipase
MMGCMNAPAPHIVFVHGLFGPFAEAATFDALRPATCSAPDLIGYGGAAGRVTSATQVRALQEHIDRVSADAPVHLVAHSIGAVWAFLAADARPDRVASLTTVEGNFSLADAFWSRSIAELDEAAARQEIEGRLADPVGFLTGDGIEPTPTHLASAEAALAYQPWRTVWESARAVVAATGGAEYEQILRRVFAALPVHLVAGERSRAGWHVPDWAVTAAASSVVVPDAGHMMMLEHPRRFAEALPFQRVDVGS